MNAALFYVSGLFPRSSRRVVFGAWLGHRYTDNPRYLFEHVVESRPDLQVVWIGREPVDDQIFRRANVRWVRRGSLRSFLEMVRARTFFVSHGYEDLAPFNLTCRGTVVYLGHGLAIKRMGTPRKPTRAGVARWLDRVWHAPIAYSFFVASSEAHAEKMCDEYSNENCRPSNVLLLGQPRCDRFADRIGTKRRDSIRDRYAEAHALPADRRLVAYLPTFRDSGEATFSFEDLDEAESRQLEAILERHRAVLVERRHFVDGVVRERPSRTDDDHVVDLSSASDVDSQDLLLVSDLLITDYSGAYVDYLLLDRPVLHFVYDYERYMTADRGLYFDLAKVAGGPMLHDLPSLLKALDEHLGDPALGTEERRRVRDLLLSAELGRSCAAVAERFLPRPRAGRR